MSVRRITFLGLPLDVDVDTQMVCNMLCDKATPRRVAFVNPYAWAVAKKDSNYLLALSNMSLVLADGEGVACACRLLLKEKCSRISFDMSSLADAFFKRMLTEKASLMLVGGKPGVTDATGEKLRKYYPGLKIVETTHGYDSVEVEVEQIMRIKPDVVIVGMGIPKQEALLVALHTAGYKGFAITCGGFFDQYLESHENYYYPKLINRWNLRFLYRLLKEPRRLWRRYFVDYQIFLMYVFTDMFKRASGKVFRTAG